MARNVHVKINFEDPERVDVRDANKPKSKTMRRQCFESNEHFVKSNKADNTSLPLVKFICKTLERSGVVDFHLQSRKQDWKRSLLQFYVYVVHFMITLYMVLHLLSTLCRSVRHMPEFFQRVTEDVCFSFCFIGVRMSYCYYDEIKSLSIFMETSLSHPDDKIAKEHKKRAYFAFFVIAFGNACMLMMVFIASLIPLSEQELEILRFVYRTKHPERRLFLTIWVPFIDETVSWYYELIYVLEIWPIFVLALVLATTGALLFVSVILLQEQYTILSTYVRKIGQIHTDVLGNSVYYTNIESGEFMIKPTRRSSMRSVVEKVREQQRERQRQQLYEKLYIRQLIRYHQKLCSFQTKVIALYDRYMLPLLLIASSLMTFLIYQLTLSSNSISNSLRVKFIFEFFGMAGDFYLLTHTSDELDDCHGILRQAMIDCDWHQCSNETKRDLCIFLRQIQRPNHLTFTRGLFVLSKEFVVKLVKVTYNFVNYMRV